MVTVYRFIKAFILLLLLLVLSPLILLWYYLRYLIFRYVFIRNLRKCGIDRDTSAEIADHLRIRSVLL
jgi:hypothetical protein